MISAVINFSGWHKPEISTPISSTRMFYFAVLVAIYAVLIGCSDTNTDQSTIPGTIAVEITPTSVTMSPLKTQQFTAMVTNTVNNAVNWQVDDIEGGNANVGTISTSGLYTAPADPGSHVIKAISIADPRKTASVTITIQAAPTNIMVEVTPTAVTISVLQSQQFSATVNNSSNQAVTWQVDNIQGGNSTVGTINSEGLYTAPAAAGTHTIKAVSVVDSTQSGSATVTVQPATPAITVAISPTTAALSPLQTQQFSATVNNSSNQAVTWQVDDIDGGNSSVGTISSSGLYTAPSAAGSHVIKATSVANSAKSASATVTVSLTPAISVNVTPATASVASQQTQQFSATVNNSSNQAVTWQVDDISGGNTTVGTISTNGLYTAPIEAGTHVIKAISVADTTKSGGATVTVSTNTAITVEVTPAAATVATLQSQQFTATVSNSSNTAVIWQVDDIEGGNANVGTISASGLYTAPSDDGTHVIKAVSVVDSTKSGSATVTVFEVESISGVFTYHNDNARTGQNLKEGILTPANVNSQTFGKLFSLSVDGYVYAQPLYVSNLSIKGQTRNVLFVATEGNSVYAFDADKPGNPLWQTSFIDPANGISTVPYQDTATAPDYTGPGPIIPGGCTDLTPQIGITGTPVIDPATATLYVVAKTKEKNGNSFNYEFRIHALDITTGSGKSGSGKAIDVSVPGSTAPNEKNRVVFKALRQNQRAALLLSNNILTVAFSSHCVIRPYQGWVISYDAKNLELISAFNVVPNDSKGKGGIWHSGGGPAADANGNVYVMTGDGPFDADTGGDSYSNSVLKLQNGSLALTDYFTPFNQKELENANADMSAGGPLLLPNQSADPQRTMFSMGKQGIAYLLNRDNMGKFQAGSNSQILQSFRWGTCGSGNCLIFGTPAYFNNTIYMAAIDDSLRAYSLVDGVFYPSSQSTNKFPWPGASPVVSANGTSNGIVWALQTNGSGAPAILHAYPADFVSTRLYSSDENSARDNPGPAVKFTIPTVANGKVYVASTSQVSVYGLLP